MFTAKQGAKLTAANALHSIREQAIEIRSQICFEQEDTRLLDDIIHSADTLLTRLIPNI